MDANTKAAAEIITVTRTELERAGWSDSTDAAGVLWLWPAHDYGVVSRDDRYLAAEWGLTIERDAEGLPVCRAEHIRIVRTSRRAETITDAEMHARRCEASSFTAALYANLDGKDNAGARKAFNRPCDAWWRGQSERDSLRQVVEAVASTIVHGLRARGRRGLALCGGA